MGRGPPYIHVQQPRVFSMHAATVLADSDDEVHIPRFTHFDALISCESHGEVLLPRPFLFRLSSTFPS